MNCKDAQKVWGHPGGFLAGLKTTYPEVLDRLERLASNLIGRETNPFHEAIKRKAGTVTRPYYVEHADDNDTLAHQVHDVVGDTAAKLELEQYLSEKFSVPITIGNLCCGGCKATIGRLSHQEILAIQNAAIRTNADGSDIIL